MKYVNFGKAGVRVSRLAFGLDRHLEKEMFPLLRDTGQSAMAYSPLHIGLLNRAHSRDLSAVGAAS